MADLISQIAREFLKKFIEGDTGPEIVRSRMAAAQPKIVAGMLAKGMTPESTALPLVIRDALFRLIRAVVPSGDISDFLRDRSEDRITPRVIAALVDNRSLPEIVEVTRDVLIELWF